MTVSDLFNIKERLLKELREETRPEDFANHEAYEKHLLSKEDGIIQFYLQGLYLIMESPDKEIKKKSA